MKPSRETPPSCPSTDCYLVGDRWLGSDMWGIRRHITHMGFAGTGVGEKARFLGWRCRWCSLWKLVPLTEIEVDHSNEPLAAGPWRVSLSSSNFFYTPRLVSE